MHESDFGQISAKVGISSEDSGSTVLKKAMKRYCHNLHVHFQNLSETLEAAHFSLQGMVDLLPVDASYNIFHEAGKTNFTYDVFTMNNIGNVLNLAAAT